MIEWIGRSPRTKLAAVAIAIVLAGAAAGALATLAIAPTYAATTTVLVGSLERPSIANDFDVSSGVASIYGNLIRSEAVLGPVIQRLGLPTDWQELRERVHVDLDPNGIPIITVTTYADSPAGAVAIAQGITDRMIELSGPGLAQIPPALPTMSSANDLEVAIAGVERRLARLERQAKTAPTKAQGKLERSIEGQSALLMTLQDDYRRSTDVPRGGANQLEVLRSAQANGGEIRPRVPMDAALGATVAALSAAAVALAIGFRKRAASRAKAGSRTTALDPWALELTQASQDAYAGTTTSSVRR